MTNSTSHPKMRFDPELQEMERYCPDCREYWPATREFFFSSGRRGGRIRLHTYCKACYAQRRKRYRHRRADAVQEAQETLARRGHIEKGLTPAPDRAPAWP